MLHVAIKYMLNLIILTSTFGVWSTEDVFFHLGCYTSMLMGFMLQLGRIRRKQDLTWGVVGWQAIITVSICWGAFLFQKSFYPKIEGFALMGYLFCAAFFAMIISDTAYRVADISFKEWFKTLARKYMLDDDKEETQ